MKRFLQRNTWWIGLTIAAILLFAHTTELFDLQVDSTALILLGIILLSPLVSSLKRIKYGELEAEIGSDEVKKIKEQVPQDLKEVPSSLGPRLEVFDAIDKIRELVDTDVILALAKLRIELEKVITKLHRLTQPPSQRRRPFWSLVRIVRELSQTEVIPEDLVGPITQVLSICNRALHGEDIRSADARSIVDIGTSLLERLYFQAKEVGSEPDETEPITHETLEDFQEARYRVTTVIPYTEPPVRNVRILNQEALDEFLEGYVEFAEFLIGIEKVNEPVAEKRKRGLRT